MGHFLKKHLLFNNSPIQCYKNPFLLKIIVLITFIMVIKYNVFQRNTLKT